MNKTTQIMGKRYYKVTSHGKNHVSIRFPYAETGFNPGDSIIIEKIKDGKIIITEKSIHEDES